MSFTFCFGIFISITSIYSGSKVILYYKRNLNALQSHKKENKQKSEANKGLDTNELHTTITYSNQENVKTTNTISYCELDQQDINKNFMSVLLTNKPCDSNVDFATNNMSNCENGDSNIEKGKIIFPKIENKNCINLPPDYLDKNLLRLSNEKSSISEDAKQTINVMSTIKAKQNDNIISVNLNYSTNKTHEDENTKTLTNKIHEKTEDFIYEGSSKELPSNKINLKIIPKSKHISFQDKSIRKLAMVTIVLSLFGLGYCVVVICPLVITLSIQLSSDPWVWYAEQSTVRCLECGMVLTMAYLARRNLLCCSKRH